MCSSVSKSIYKSDRFLLVHPNLSIFSLLWHSKKKRKSLFFSRSGSRRPHVRARGWTEHTVPRRCPVCGCPAHQHQGLPGPQYWHPETSGSHRYLPQRRHLPARLRHPEHFDGNCIRRNQRPPKYDIQTLLAFWSWLHFYKYSLWSTLFRFDLITDDNTQPNTNITWIHISTCSIT